MEQKIVSATEKPFIYHFCPTPNRLGGIWSWIRIQLESSLTEKYCLEVYELPDYHTGGLDFQFIKELARHFREKKPDILHNHGLGPTAFHAAVAARLAKCPCVILSCHNFIEDLQFRRPLRKWVVANLMEPYTIRQAHATFCVSAYGSRKPVIGRYARRNLGHINNAIEIRPLETPNPALRAAFGFGPKDVVALCTTRLSREKGILDLQEAMTLLEQRGTNLKLLLVGDGPDKEVIEERLKEAIQAGRIVMPGRRDDVYPLLAISDMFVLPTLHENQSLSLLEAMVSAKPIVTTRVGGNPELVVDGETGILVPASAPQALADGLERMAKDADLRERMGDAARARAESCFSIEQLVKRMDALYTEMLSGKQ